MITHSCPRCKRWSVAWDQLCRAWLCQTTYCGAWFNEVPIDNALRLAKHLEDDPDADHQ